MTVTMTTVAVSGMAIPLTLMAKRPLIVTLTVHLLVVVMYTQLLF